MKESIEGKNNSTISTELEEQENNPNGNPSGNPNGENDTLQREKKDWKYFWRRVSDDLTNKNLFSVKILFFFKYATLFVLYPFLTIHMDSLGLNEWEIGINQATAPIIAILGPPFAGLVADKIGNFKVLLSILTGLNAGVSLLLLLVPVARETLPLPKFMTFELSCSEPSNNSSYLQNQFILQSIDSFECKFNSTIWSNLPNSLIQCGNVCTLNDGGNNGTIELTPPLPRFTYKSRFESSNNEKVSNYLLSDGFHTFEPFLEQSEPPILCQRDALKGEEKCTLDLIKNETIYKSTNSTDNPSISNLNQSAELIRPGRLKLLNENDSKDTNSPSRGVGEETERNVLKLNLGIENGFNLNGIFHDNPICTGPDKTEDNNKPCLTSCLIQYDTPLFCKNPNQRKIYNVGLSFGLYTVFRLILGFTSATSFIMFEGAVLAIMKQYGGDYGLQRVSATLAAMIAAPISGLLLNAYGFHPVIYLYAGLQLFSALITLKIDLQFKKPAQKVIRNLKEVLSQVEILLFFGAILWAGTAWGYLETFLFLFLKKLGGTPLLMGLTITVGGIAGLPLLIFNRPIIKRLGHVNVICLGLLFYCFRLLGYSLIYDPWLCLIFEALEAVTASLALTAASTYAVALSTLQTIASIQGIFGCLYFGIGRGAGSLLGGILIRSFGHRETFRIFSIGSLIGATLYGLINVFYLRKNSVAGRGLDINNLASYGGEGESKDSNHNGKESGVGGGGDGGFVGPLDVNRFTDVPLDEDNSNGNEIKQGFKV